MALRYALCATCRPSGTTCPLCHLAPLWNHLAQVQERLTNQVAEAALGVLGARSVLVVVESAHMCMVARGVEKHASTTLTTAARGGWACSPAVRAEVLSRLLARREGNRLQ